MYEEDTLAKLPPEEMKAETLAAHSMVKAHPYRMGFAPDLVGDYSKALVSLLERFYALLQKTQEDETVKTQVYLTLYHAFRDYAGSLELAQDKSRTKYFMVLERNLMCIHDFLKTGNLPFFYTLPEEGESRFFPEGVVKWAWFPKESKYLPLYSKDYVVAKLKEYEKLYANAFIDKKGVVPGYISGLLFFYRDYWELLCKENPPLECKTCTNLELTLQSEGKEFQCGAGQKWPFNEPCVSHDFIYKGQEG
jgi:hypothetical protein